jgi:hypothetical protein
MSMQIVLRIHRTMTGEEIDRAIATVLAGQALAVERLRRADWRKRELSARSFHTEYDHAEGRCRILHKIGWSDCGAEIDDLISDLQACKALAVERGRRKRWQRVIENAAAFDHA